ncbi:MAG TPA: VOC family protein [Actinomycetota bacterium]
MLKDQGIHPTIPVADIERARAWYEEKLGLLPSSDDPGGLTFRCGDGTWFVLYPSAAAGTAEHTVAGWAVDGIEAEMKELRARGVAFEDYDLPELKTVDGLAHLGDEKACWFKDSEGNILGLIQLARPRA